MFVKMIYPNNIDCNCFDCSKIEYREDQIEINDVPTKLHEFAITTKESTCTYEVPLGTAVYVMNEEGKTVDHYHIF